MGKISRRPIIIHSDMTILDRWEKAEKLPVGPTSSKPGPTLLIHVRAELKDTEKGKSSKEMIRVAANMMKR